MNPMRVEGSVLYGKPKNWNEERDGICGYLPVVHDGLCCLSVWKLTDAERAQIAEGHNIILSVVGGQPPVNLATVPPVVSGELVIINPED